MSADPGEAALFQSLFVQYLRGKMSWREVMERWLAPRDSAGKDAKVVPESRPDPARRGARTGESGSPITTPADAVALLAGLGETWENRGGNYWRLVGSDTGLLGSQLVERAKRKFRKQAA